MARRPGFGDLLLRAVGVLGRLLVAAGLLVLAFVAYQLWGTDLHEQAAQATLRQQLHEVLAGESPTTTQPGPTAPGQTTVPPSTVAGTIAPTEQLTPDIGGVVGEIDIPKLHVKKVVIQGVDLEELDQAPGHYPNTPFPGQAGNAAIAGHRTTYGAPFHNVDRLTKGDEIIVTTRQGTFHYVVERVFIVDPYAAWVLDPDPDHPNALTLTACHPKYDLTQRIIVRASLKGTPAPKLPDQDRVQRAQVTAQHAGDNGLADGSTGARKPGAWTDTTLWGLLCAAIALAAWLLARRYGRRLVIYPAATLIFCVALYFFFENLTLVLPAGV